ncbi:unnamed protein product [Nezara viridula]|uniref:Uncharacterized protein n=1 Tax=Nezara viridula TaxID=85310 RepID=A0A9P0HCL1_NEZVI|nr:unnamed protein product [Nezara viridula]
MSSILSRYGGYLRPLFPKVSSFITQLSRRGHLGFPRPLQFQQIENKKNLRSSLLRNRRTARGSCQSKPGLPIMRRRDGERSPGLLPKPEGTRSNACDKETGTKDSGEPLNYP